MSHTSTIHTTANSLSIGSTRSVGLPRNEFEIEPAGIGITVLFEPEKDDDCVDIVFVHGLNSRPTDCWRKGGRLWPRDFLHKSIHNARIMTFGYSSYNIDDASLSRIKDHARNLLEDLSELRSKSQTEYIPIIFVSYSLGGLVVKQALVSAKYHSQFKHVSSCVTGICFMGTPHAGNRVTSMGEMVSNMARVSFKKPDMAMVESLKDDSDDIDELLKEFDDIVKTINIINVYELRKTIYKKGILKPSLMVVPELTAKMGKPNEALIGSDSDHLEVCKFDGEEDKRYQRVAARLQTLCETAYHTLKAKNIDSLLWSVENMALGTKREQKSASRQGWMMR